MRITLRGKRGSYSKMAGRFSGEYAYAFLRRWDSLSERWEDHFSRDALVEVIFRGRATLVCGTHNAPQSVCVLSPPKRFFSCGKMCDAFLICLYLEAVVNIS